MEAMNTTHSALVELHSIACSVIPLLLYGCDIITYRIWRRM